MGTKTNDVGSKLTLQLKLLSQLMAKEEKLKAQLAPISTQISELRDRLINEYTDAQLQSVTAAGLRVSRTTTMVPSLKDLDQFLAFATKKANWDLLSGVDAKAWRLRMERGVTVPGIESFNRVGLRVNKVKATG